MSSGGSRRAAVLGHPIAHSKSPLLHRTAYAQLGLDWTYDAVDVTVEGLEDFLATLDSSWVGLSLTMPLKVGVIDYLDELTSPARELNVVNTVVFGDRGAVGHNTDVAGIQEALRSGDRAADGTVTILGGGATARSALGAIAGIGFRRVVVAVRRPEVGPGIEALSESLDLVVEIVGWDQAGAHLNADVVISTVPGPAADRLAGSLDWPEGGTAGGVLLDVVYEPWPSLLERRWTAGGGVAVPGWEMLLAQAGAQVELMTGLSAPIPAMRAALLTTL